MNATHIKSGHTGEIQDEFTFDDGRHLFYFEDHTRPTAAGWYPLSALTIEGVTA